MIDTGIKKEENSSNEKRPSDCSTVARISNEPVCILLVSLYPTRGWYSLERQPRHVPDPELPDDAEERLYWTLVSLDCENIHEISRLTKLEMEGCIDEAGLNEFVKADFHTCTSCFMCTLVVRVLCVRGLCTARVVACLILSRV